jgi:hypothetical protein
MDAYGAAIPHMLFSGLRTGSPLLDAALMAALFTLLNMASVRMDYVRQALRQWTAQWLRGCWWAREEACLHVPRVFRVINDYGSSYDGENSDYVALAWYLSHRAPIHDGRAVVASMALISDRMRKQSQTQTQTQGGQTILPEGDQTVDFEHDGHGISYARTYIEREREDKIVVVQKERIELRLRRLAKRSSSAEPCTPMRVLLDVVEAARAQYAEHVKTTTWTQHMFSLSPCKDGGTDMVWKGAPTHSGGKNFDTIVLDDDVKADLVGDLATFLAGEAWYERMGLSYKRGYLLHGPPGTGKTSIVLAIAGVARADIYHLNLAQLTTDAMLDKAFHDMPPRCVVVFDDIDAMGRVVHDRRRNGDDEIAAANAFSALAACSLLATAKMAHVSSDDPIPSRLTLSCLLNHLDGVGCNHGRIFVVTTNHPDRLDPALVRPGRADMALELGPCSSRQLRLFFEMFATASCDDGAMADAGMLIPEIDALPAGALTPAQVSSVLLQHRGDLGRGVRRLADIAGRG